jgi:hypothetical protein
MPCCLLFRRFKLDAAPPPSLGFQILTPAPIRMEEGTLIDYEILLRGLLLVGGRIYGIPFEFIDEQ